ncbi:MAG TPA: hypothetical protein VFI92_08080, partial [Steroidobacteraceae bacterium]|nr:hypothetical protein [Steroidobacteraceae bacterium]
MPAGRVLAGVVAIATVLMSGSIALGYRIAMERQGEAASIGMSGTGGSMNLKRPENLVVVDRIGDLSGRLTRLEIEAAEFARRLGIAPANA